MKRPINENGRTATEFANALGEQKAFKDYLQAPLLSQLFGFTAAAILFLLLKFTVRNAELYTAPKGNQALDRARSGSAQRSGAGCPLHSMHTCDTLPRARSGVRDRVAIRKAVENSNGKPQRLTRLCSPGHSGKASADNSAISRKPLAPNRA